MILAGSSAHPLSSGSADDPWTKRDAFGLTGFICTAELISCFLCLKDVWPGQRLASCTPYSDFVSF